MRKFGNVTLIFDMFIWVFSNLASAFQSRKNNHFLLLRMSKTSPLLLPCCDHYTELFVVQLSISIDVEGGECFVHLDPVIVIICVGYRRSQWLQTFIFFVFLLIFICLCLFNSNAFMKAYRPILVRQFRSFSSWKIQLIVEESSKKM